MRIDGYRPEDKSAVERLLHECGGFVPHEVTVCLSLLGDPEYETALVRDEQERPLGLVIYGTDPLAQGVWEIYWIATDGRCQRRGVGSALMRHVEESVGTRGRMILIETSGQPAYAYQRAFYEKNGYREAARIRDFYKPGDDLVVYRKDATARLYLEDPQWKSGSGCSSKG
ncbi:MAG: GNAT family N-acetyltransferase [Planctomycetes bacterium]|nr:GNAT family N-acetyltransferase [Planctomycetota bacterium]